MNACFTNFSFINFQLTHLYIRIETSASLGYIVEYYCINVSLSAIDYRFVDRVRVLCNTDFFLLRHRFFQPVAVVAVAVVDIITAAAGQMRRSLHNLYLRSTVTSVIKINESRLSLPFQSPFSPAVWWKTSFEGYCYFHIK